MDSDGILVNLDFRAERTGGHGLLFRDMQSLLFFYPIPLSFRKIMFARYEKISW